jgi:hypothetical protein
MRSAWQEFTIVELKALRNALGDASREGWLEAVGEALLAELTNVLGSRIADSLVRNPGPDFPKSESSL